MTDIPIKPMMFNLESKFDNLYWESIGIYSNFLDACHEASRLVSEEHIPEKYLRILDPKDKEL